MGPNIRTPTIAWWSSGKVKHKVSQVVGSHMDILPTFASLAGITLPPSLVLDGHNIDYVLLGDSDKHHVEYPVFFYRGNILYAVRLGWYKVQWRDHCILL